MALSVPKTMFQHMLKEGAKVCYEFNAQQQIDLLLVLICAENCRCKYVLWGFLIDSSSCPRRYDGHVLYSLSKL